MNKIIIILIYSLWITYCSPSKKGDDIEKLLLPNILSPLPAQPKEPEVKFNKLSVSSSSFDLGSTYFNNTRKSTEILIKNEGNISLNVHSIIGLSDVFSVEPNQIVLDPNTTRTILVYFQPKAIKTYQSKILFYHNSKEVLNTISVTGKGTSSSEANCGLESSSIRIKNVSNSAATIAFYTDLSLCNADINNNTGTYLFSNLENNSTTIYYCIPTGSFYIGYLGSNRNTCTNTAFTFNPNKDYTIEKHVNNISIKDDGVYE